MTISPDYDRLVDLCRKHGINWQTFHYRDAIGISATRALIVGEEFLYEMVMPPVAYPDMFAAIAGLFDRILTWLPLHPIPEGAKFSP